MHGWAVHNSYGGFASGKEFWDGAGYKVHLMNRRSFDCAALGSGWHHL